MRASNRLSIHKHCSHNLHILCGCSPVRQILFAEVRTSPFASVGQGLTSCDDLLRMCHCHHCQLSITHFVKVAPSRSVSTVAHNFNPFISTPAFSKLRHVHLRPTMITVVFGTRSLSRTQINYPSTYMSHMVAERLLTESGEAFAPLDKDGDGILTSKELGAIMWSLGQNLTG